MTVFAGESFVNLPVGPPDPKDDALRSFDVPEQAPERGLLTNETVYTTLKDCSDVKSQPSARFEAIDLDLDHMISPRYRISEDDPRLAAAELVQKTLFRQGQG
jgi:hypothetical protein